MQEKKEKFDKKIKHYQCLYQFNSYTSVKFPANNIEDNIDGIETEEQEVNDKIKITRVIITNEKTFRDFFFWYFFTNITKILQQYYNNITFIQHS